MRDRKNKTVCFKLTDAYEKKLLAHAESANEHGDYSKYIKRLIGRDMEGQVRHPVAAVKIAAPVFEKTQEDFEGFT